MTKKNRRLSRLFGFLSFICVSLPILIFLVLAFVNGSVASQTTLGITFIIAIILTLINVIFKYHLRCTLWILLLGIYASLGNILNLLIIMAITTCLDEFAFTPLHIHYKNKYIINKEIDKRDGRT